MNKKLFFLSLYTLFLLAAFWTQSRFPALNEKLLMEGNTVTSGLSFDLLYNVKIDQPLLQRTIIHAVNWLFTNWKGMFFGVFLAGALMSLFSLFGQTNSQSSLKEAMKGSLLGTPLGVCANCVAPIARGLYESGTSKARLLSVGVSSPIFNYFVVSLSFTLMPFHFATLKLSLGLILVLVIIPLLTKNSLKENPHSSIKDESKDFRRETWSFSFISSTRLIFRSTARIIYLTVPAMFLASIVGAVLIEFFPFESFVKLQGSFIDYILVATFGAIIPVPIVFDVITSHALLKSGAHPGLAMTFLFSMAPVSVYSLYIFRPILGLKTCFILFMSVVCLSVIGGKVIDHTNTSLFEKEFHDFTNIIQQRNQKVIRLIGSVCANTNDRVNCKRDLILNWAISEGQPKNCNLNSDDKLQLECRLTVGIESLDYNPDFCREYKNKNKILCEKKAAVRLSEYGLFQINRICGWNADSKIIQAACIDAKQVYQKIQSGEPCTTLNNTKQRLRCEQVKNSKLATRGSFLSLCLSNTEKWKQADCLAAVFIKSDGYFKNVGKTCTAQHCNSIRKLIKADTQENIEICKEDTICKQAFTLIQFKRNLPKFDFMTDMKIAKEFRDTEPNVKIPERRSHVYKSEFLRKNNFKVFRFPLVKKGKGSPASFFSRYEAHTLGITHLPEFRPLDFLAPINRGHGIASGDINLDHFSDLVVGTHSGIELYINTTQEGEELSFFRLPRIRKITKDYHILNLALVDLNNDGQLDIFFTAYLKGSYFIINRDKSFASSKVQALPQTGAYSTRALAFDDLDGNSFLDVVQGNWSYFRRLGNEASSQNDIFLSDGIQFEQLNSFRSLGETLSTLVFDLNNDGHKDVFFANADRTPDQILSFRRPDNSLFSLPNVFPKSSFFTMSIDIGDINNDLKPDVFTTDMNFTDSEGDYCKSILDIKKRKLCIENTQFLSQMTLMNGDYCWNYSQPRRAECFVSITAHLAIKRRRPDICRSIPKEFQHIKDLCLISLMQPGRIELPHSDDIEQVTRNTLLVSKKDSGYLEKAKDFGVVESNWSWNARFLDIDNDGWQDIYVSNGNVSSRRSHANILFHNQKGQKFLSSAKEFGLDVLAPTTSFVEGDFDLDGDLDIINYSSNSPILYLENQNPKEYSSLSVQLIDHIGNRQALGATIIVEHLNNTQQIRWLKIGGGYYSNPETIAHFGTSQASHIDRIKILWPDGKEISFKGPFTTGYRYIIERKRP